MKLNYKRTILVGFAFFLINVFWQAYDNIIPKILTDKFGLSQLWSGIIMALDNVLAVFLLPIFGALSDRCHAKRGRRTPFVLVGTLVAAVAFLGLSVVDTMQLTAISPISSVTDGTNPAYTEAMENLYDAEVSFRVNGENISLSEVYSREAFVTITPEEEAYQTYVIPARQAYAWQQTMENPVTLLVLMGLLLVVLVSMATFRSPAVALMPDVTPKPLRSKANAIINLMGAVGGILVLILGILFGTGKSVNALMPYTVFFGITVALMLAALVIFMCTVKEIAWSREAETFHCQDLEHETAQPVSRDVRGLSGREKVSLLLILASVVLWYMGYNAVTSKYSVYAGQVLGMDYNMTLIVAQASAILSYVPVGMIASRIGRRKTILGGVVLLGLSFFLASFMRQGSNIIVMNILFALAGIGWATISVNSYPMVVELAGIGDVGKYTGYYYTASMAAQIITPILSGALMTYVGMKTLFPYAAVFVAGSFITMLFVRHGDTLIQPKRDVLEMMDVDN